MSERFNFKKDACELDEDRWINRGNDWNVRTPRDRKVFKKFIIVFCRRTRGYKNIC
ncbi:MAG: hypothetical protein DDT40_01636 [candidate division WS2 bacterium]|nr:hypothetical protein [Candidatus Psychracetigena formicireducens]